MRAKILCVDDEPAVLAGLTLNLRRRYDILTATSGSDALGILETNPDVSVVMSDMRMPRMDGAALLSAVRERMPDTTRVLLTGQADLDSAVSAVNNGQLFRFLTKPCSPAQLMVALDAAVAQHQLIIAERELLEKTLFGSIKALTDALAICNPTAFGRGTRLNHLVAEMAEKIGMKQRWQVEVAATLSPLGYINLSTETSEKVYFGQPLTDAEKKVVDRAPALTEQLISHIPRLDVVRGILKHQGEPPKHVPEGDTDAALIARGAQLLRVALDFDTMVSSGLAPSQAISLIQQRGDTYPADVVTALATVRGGDRANEVREISIAQVTTGMVFAEDVKLLSGALLAARGYEVTAGFIERINSYRDGLVKEPVRIVLKRNAAG